MGKKNAQIAELENKLKAMEADRDSWKRLADSRLLSLHSLHRRLDDQAIRYQKGMVAASQAVAAEASRMITEIQHQSDLRVLAAQRDAVGDALRYTLDNLTLNK